MSIRLVILGCGAVTQIMYVPVLKALRSHFEVVAACDVAGANRQCFHACFPSAKLFSDYRDLLQAVNADAAIIALPHTLHKAAILHAFDGDLDVLCEKPLAITAGDCDEIERGRCAARRLLGVGLFRRHFPSVRAIHAMLAANALGAVTSFDFHHGSVYDWPAASLAMFDASLSGGGVLMDAGAHDLDLLLWWLGEADVLRYADDCVAGGVECDCALELHLGSGARGTMRLSRSADLNNVFHIVCERGVLTWNYDDALGFRLALNGTAQMYCAVAPANGSFARNRYLAAFQVQLETFAGACRNRDPEGLVNAVDARHSVHLVEAAYSLREPLNLPWLQSID